jgi:hypothetical protein
LATISASAGISPGVGAPSGPGVGTVGACGTFLLGGPGATLFPGYPHGSFYGVPPATGPFSATAFLRGLSPHPSTVTAANSALAAALENAKTAAAAAEERVRVAALAWEQERSTAATLARQVAEAERFLHASAGARFASSP